MTNDLSRIAGAFVIARNTAFTFKGKPFDVKTIDRELNVRSFWKAASSAQGIA